MKQCFEQEKEKMVNFVFVGDSRIRNLFEYFVFLHEGRSGWSSKKAHHNLLKVYKESNLKMDFLWGNQMENTKKKDS
jgi:hypothetical protein